MPLWRTQVRLDYPGDGGPGYNAWHFRTTDGASGLAAATEALEDFYTALAPQYSSGVTITGDGTWSRVPGEGVPAGVQVDTPGFAFFGSGGDPLPEFVCGLIRWRTLRAGRTGRGRTFLSPLRQGALDTNGNMTPAARTAIAGAAQGLIDAGEGALNGAFGVYSRTAGVLSDYETASVPFEWASLTSRRD